MKLRMGHSPRRRWALGLSAAAVTGTVLSGSMAVAAYAAPAQPAASGQAAAGRQAAAAGQAATSGQAAAGRQAAASGQTAATGQAAASGQAAAGRQAAASGQTAATGQAAASGQAATSGQAAAGGEAAAGGYTPASRTLKMGMKGADIKRLQLRLKQLGYYPGSTDGHFGMDTEEAVWAFQEVQNLHASGEITWPVEKKLVYPSTPRALVRHGGPARVEVSLGRHVLYVYHSNKIVLISHISSGGGYYYCDNGCSRAITPTGNFRTTWRVKGWHTSPLGQMYNPVFFYSGYAVHGDTYVPLNPVSHGCVRVPMDVASIYPGLVPRKGIPVYVRASG